MSRYRIHMNMGATSPMTEEQKIETIAEACHEVNRVLCRYAQPDLPWPPWDQAPDWQVDATKQGVLFNLECPLASPGLVHEEWVKDKKRNGWVWGPIKDPHKKTHPHLVPFDDLPVEEQAKDVIFRATVHAVASRMQG